MNTEKLSQRLETVAKYIPTGYKLADIGSDHAYLPCYLVKKGIVPFAIAGEVVEGPFQSAKNQVQAEGLLDKISVRMGDGLEVIEKGEVDCITIAGMGGALIANILEKGSSKLSTVKRLILQPNISAVSVRTWLLHNDWELIGEEIIEEDSKIYEVLIAERGNPNNPYKNQLEKRLLLGPFLMDEHNAVFKKKWLTEKKNWERIIRQIELASETAENKQKWSELQEKIKLVEEVIK